ncbi:MAG TPA: peptidylprolyl isomerase [Terriglobales bacterium]|nr:peptidylprolyl isomerase [Terriglobales bacterium]
MKWTGLALLLAIGLVAGSAQMPAGPRLSPQQYQVGCHTTSGDFTIAVHREWAPHGADRFYELVASGYYSGNALYRVIAGFVAQWGLSPNPADSARWRKKPIPDDAVAHSNLAGTIAFAANGPRSRTAEVFINLRDSKQLDKLGFAPFGEVIGGMDTVREFSSAYGDGPPHGHGPDPRLVFSQGAAYWTAHFPRLDVIYYCRVLP